MKAIAHTAIRDIDDPRYLEDLTLEPPTPGAHDLRVRVEAVAVNPIDLKVHGRRPASAESPVILGFDAAGVVESVGAAVARFGVGDPVFYAGSVARSGCNAELHCVDERLVGPKPTTLDFADSAALALTGLTAWELLFDLMALDDDAHSPAGPVLVLGGAGGVASMAVQLLAAFTDRTVIATASQPDSAEHARTLGAHHVIDYRQDYRDQLAAAGIDDVAAIFSTHTTAFAWENFARVIRPFGRIGFIDDPAPLDVSLLKARSVALYGEGMFNRSVFATDDMIRQHEILTRIARGIDGGNLKATTGQHFGTINAANLRAAHRHVAAGHARGKAVLSGFG